MRTRLWSLKGDDTNYIMDKHGFGSIVPEECGGALPGLLRDLLEAQVGSEGELAPGPTAPTNRIVAGATQTNYNGDDKPWNVVSV